MILALNTFKKFQSLYISKEKQIYNHVNTNKQQNSNKF